MLNEHTLDQLRGLRLDGMVHALADQATSAAAAELAFDERLAMLVQRKVDWRDGKRLARFARSGLQPRHRAGRRRLAATG